jgi:hypothetical protein
MYIYIYVHIMYTDMQRAVNIMMDGTLHIHTSNYIYEQS